MKRKKERKKERCSPALGTHCSVCRPSRPRCRERRGSSCTCLAYPFPHRRGSGLCGQPRRMVELVWGPLRAETLEATGDSCEQDREEETTETA
jgi:hypothetical protein